MGNTRAMPWMTQNLIEKRLKFEQLASLENANVAELCRRFAVSRKTGYKWCKRHAEEGLEGLQDRSRRPQHSPGRAPATVVSQVLELRAAHPAWGPRKIKRRLEDLGATR